MDTDRARNADAALLDPGHHVAFPPGSGFVMLPSSPRRAARAGLALYETVETRQRVAALAGRVITTAGLSRLLPRNDRPEVDRQWWRTFVAQVVQPQVGPIASIAFRVPGNPRVSALLMDGDGRPVAFAKLLNSAAPERTAALSRLLSSQDTTTFRVPRTLAEGAHDGWDYRLLEPLPEGAHRSPPFLPATVAAIADEFHERAAGLPRPAGIPEGHVLCHADLTPRNLRLAADRRWWLFDWDNARWGPRMSDELRYWCAWFSYRRRPDVDRDARRVHGLLRRRGTEAEIQEAVHWPDRVAQTFRPVETTLLSAVGRVAA